MQRREVHLRLVSRCACPRMLLPSLTSASVQAVVSLRDNAVLQAQLTSRPIDLLRLANNGTGASSERSRGRWIVLIILPRRELLYECVRGAGLTCRCVLTSTAELASTVALTESRRAGHCRSCRLSIRYSANPGI